MAVDRSSEKTCEVKAPDPRAVIAILMAGTFLAPLDSSIVNIALPSIAEDFGARLAAVGWVATAYLLANASLVLGMGRLGDVWGLRKVYISGFVVFGLGSAACAVSPELSWLIGARVLQAIGASMIFAAGPALVTRTFPPRKRGWALGWISLSVSAGLTAGPALGGLLLKVFGWQSIFVVNLPLAVIVIVGALRLLPDDCPEPEPFDFVGAIMATVTLTVLLLGFSEIDQRGLGSAWVLGAFGLSIVLATLFVIFESRVAHPMVDLKLFRDSAFSAGVGSAVLSYMSLFAVTFTMPFYLLKIQALDPAVVGLLLTATPVSMALISPGAGRLSDRWGSRGLTTAGLVVLSLALVAATGLAADTEVWKIAVLLVFVGSGLSLFGAPNTAGILRATPKDRVGVGSALTGQARNLGMTLGIAVTAAVVSSLLGAEGSMDISGSLSAQEGETFMRALRPAWGVAAGVAAAGAVVSWMRGPDRPKEVESDMPTPVDSRK